MTPVTTAKGSFIFVEVPDDAYKIDKCWQEYGKVRADRRCTEVQYFSKSPIHPNYRSDNPKEMGVIHLFNKETLFDIIATTKDITEEQAAEIVAHHVGRETNYYHNYLPCKNCRDFRDIIDHSFETAKESLQSLVQSVGLNTAETHLILKKQ